MTPFVKKPDELLSALGTTAESGISSAEAAARKEKYGENKLKEKQKITVYGRSDKDVIAAACDGGLCNVQVLSIREGKLIGRN